MSDPRYGSQATAKPSQPKIQQKLIKYNFGIDAEWCKKDLSSFDDREREKLINLKQKVVKNHLIAIAIEDWQNEQTHFYEHIEYGKKYINKIWSGLPSLCELIDAVPVSLPETVSSYGSIIINLHHFFSPYDIYAFICDKIIYRSLCICLERKRILKTKNKGKIGSNVDRSGYFKMPWYVKKHDRLWQIKLNIIDYSGLAGEEGYQGTCAAYGIQLASKKLMNRYKDRMNFAYDDLLLREKFIKYTCGDVKFKQLNQAVIDANNYVRKEVLKIPTKRKITMTKGSETAQLFFDFLLDYFQDFDRSDIPYMRDLDRFGNLKPARSCLEKLIKSSSVKEIVKNSNKELTTPFLAMVMGGRCKNEIPHRSVYQEPIVSMDLKSCYGLGLKYAYFPIGRSVILDFPDRDPHSWISLREMLKKYEKELVPGCWFAIIDTNYERLSFNQSLFVSNSAKSVELKVDFDDSSIVNIEGTVGIYLNQIKNGVLTHHSLETARAIMTLKEWAEFSRKVKIKAMSFHPKSLMVETIDELIDKHKKHKKGHLTTKITSDFKTTLIEDSRCRYWYKFNISHFINPILSERLNLKKQLKDYDLNSEEYFLIDSKQKLLKLFINSLYGGLSSQFFKISNSLVGNNITDKARCACFIMAKTTNGVNSITDGSESPLMRFLVFKTAPSMKILTNYQFGLISTNTKRSIVERSLGGYEWDRLKLSKNKAGNFTISFPDGRVFITGKSNQSWDFIGRAYEGHIRDFFTRCKLTPQWVNEYKYEDKGIFKGIAVQSAANYYLERYESDRDLEAVKIKARGYSIKKKYYSCFEGEYDRQIAPPIKNLMTDIYKDLEIQSYSKCQVLQILKVNEWNKKNAIDPDFPLLPGETISRNIRPFAIKVAAFYYPDLNYRQTLEKLQQILESCSDLGMGALFTQKNGSYNYISSCQQIQTDILSLNIKEFKSKYQRLLELLLGYTISLY